MGVGVLKGECFIFDKEGVGKSKKSRKIFIFISGEKVKKSFQQKSKILISGFKKCDWKNDKKFE